MATQTVCDKCKKVMEKQRWQLGLTLMDEGGEPVDFDTRTVYDLCPTCLLDVNDAVQSNINVAVAKEMLAQEVAAEK